MKLRFSWFGILQYTPKIYTRFTFCCAFHDDVIKWKHFPRYWPFVRGIHRSPVNSPHKGQWHGALMFSLICVWINDKVNNREAGDLRRYHSHYDVIVMYWKYSRMTRSVPLLHMTWLLTSPGHQQSWYLWTVEQTIVRLVIWDAIAPIMTSL